MESGSRLEIKKKPALIALGVVVLGGILLQAYFKLSAQAPAGAGTPGVEKISVKAPGSDWQTYANNKLGFEVKYPADTTLRGTPDSDFAILTLPSNTAGGKQALITFSKKVPPLGKTYASLEDFWLDGKADIEKNGGAVSDPKYVELGGVTFWQAEEKNSTNNFIGLHRYIQKGANIYEGTLTIEGDVVVPAAKDAYDRILNTFRVRA